MASALDILDDLAPISELSNGRTSALLQRADHDPVILIKRNKPSYVLMNIENYRALMERIEDNEDLLLAEKKTRQQYWHNYQQRRGHARSRHFPKRPRRGT